MNSLSNASRYILVVVIAFFLTPFTINAVGNTAYGTWLVLLAVLGYATILEMGIQRATIKLVAEHRAAGDVERMNGLIATAFYFYVAVGVMLALIVAFPIQAILSLSISDPGWRILPRWMFILLGADVACIFLNYVFTGILYGFQFYHAKNLIDLAAYVANAALLVAFLRGGGLFVLLAVKIGVDAASLLATCIAAKHVFPALSLSPRMVSTRSVRELISFSGRLLLSSTLSRVATYAQPIIIGARLSTEATAFFGVPRRLVDYVREIHWALATGFMPAFSDLHRRQEATTVRSIYLRYSRYLLFVMVPAMALIFGYGPAFISRWVGAEYAAQGTGVLYFLTAAYVAELAQPLAWSLFIGVGYRLNLIVLVSAAASLLTIVGSLFCIGPYGITGVAMVFFVVFLAQQVVFTTLVCSFLRISFIQFTREVYLYPIGAGILAFVLTWGFRAILGRETYGAMITGGLGAIIGYALSVYFLFLNNTERSWLRIQCMKLGDRLRVWRNVSAPRGPSDET